MKNEIRRKTNPLDNVELRNNMIFTHLEPDELDTRNTQAESNYFFFKC